MCELDLMYRGIRTAGSDSNIQIMPLSDICNKTGSIPISGAICEEHSCSPYDQFLLGDLVFTQSPKVGSNIGH